MAFIKINRAEEVRVVEDEKEKLAAVKTAARKVAAKLKSVVTPEDEDDV